MLPNYSSSNSNYQTWGNAIFYGQFFREIFATSVLLPNSYNLLLGKFCAALSFTSRPIRSVPRYLIVAVAFTCSNIKMLRVYATGVIAMVTNKFITRHFFSEKNERCSMGPPALAAKAKTPVSVFIGVALPLPAPVSANRYESHKPCNISHGSLVP